MPPASGTFAEMVTALVPSLSRSLAEQFNVFRVMHHGTHEKQLSNVFAWLLSANGTHGLGDAFQRIFLEQVNRTLPAGSQLPTSGYRVVQEVNTSGPDEQDKDIADIVLSGAGATVVVENFGTSDGHGHDYCRYLAHGHLRGQQSVVVLLCAVRESYRQTDGWEHAVVVTYAELLDALKIHVTGDTVWQRAHPRQRFFIEEMFQHFLEGPSPMSNEDQIAFITMMCETGESARYGQRPQDVAAQEFADLLAHHAKRQFEQGRATLGSVKSGLRQFAERTVMWQVNDDRHSGQIASIRAQFAGQWEWCVMLERSDAAPAVYLEFGPTVVVENDRAAQPVENPDYSKVFVTRQAASHDGIDQIIQTEVGLDEVLAGLSGDDRRLSQKVVAIIDAT